MRLMLHGRTNPSMLQSRLEQSLKQQQQQQSCDTNGENNETTTTTAAPRRQRDITNLLLSNWDGDDEDLQVVIDDLCCILEENTTTTSTGHNKNTIKEVTLLNCHGSGLQRLVSTIIKYSNVQKLSIRYSGQEVCMPESIARGLLEGCCGHFSNDDYYHPRIQELDLRGMTLTPAVVERLCCALVNCQELTALVIRGNFLVKQLDSHGASIVGPKANEEQQELVTKGLVRLVADCLPQLQVLDLEECHIPDTYLQAILEAVASRNTVHTLRLKGNMVQTMTVASIHDWMVQPSCSLTSLDLSWQRLPFSKRMYSLFCDLPLLAMAIAENTSLQTLKLSENQLADAHFAKLVAALEENSTLKSLELKDCRIQDLPTLAASLSNLSLRRLDLNGNQRWEGCRKKNGLKQLFLEPLTKNVYLYDLILPYGESSKSLEWVLEWNRAGRRVLLEDDPNFPPPSLWPVLLERADRVGRQYPSEKDAVRHGASAIYLLMRERGHSCCIPPHY